MKRIVLTALLLFSLTAVTAFAEVISANNVSIRQLKSICSNKYGTRIDEDGDLILTSKGNKIIVMHLPKVKLVLIRSTWKKPNKASISDLIVRANKFNYDKRFLRISVNPEDGSSVCDYYFIYDGGLDTRNFLESVEWFYSLEDDWQGELVEANKE